MSIFLHRYKIDENKIKEMKVGCFYINEKVAEFFKNKVEAGYIKQFYIAAVTPFLYDRYKEIDYVKFSQNAILGLEPVIYTEANSVTYIKGIEKQLSEILAFSMSKEWADFSRKQGNILEYKEVPIMELEDKFVRNQIIAVRIGKEFIGTKVNLEKVDELLSGFDPVYSQDYRKMPQRYFILRENSKINMVSEVVEQRNPITNKKTNRFFCYSHTIRIERKDGDFYLSMENGLKQILLDIRNKKEKLCFYRDMNRNLLFTQYGDDGINLSTIRIDKRFRDNLKILNKSSEEYAEYVGLKNELSKYEQDTSSYLFGNTRIYMTCLPEDKTRIKSKSIKNGSGLGERLFEYITYEAKLPYLKPLNNKLVEIPLNWKTTGAKSGYRSLEIFEKSAKKLSELKEFKLGIVSKNAEEIKEDIEEIMKKVSHHIGEKAKVPYVFFIKDKENVFNVVRHPDGDIIFKIKVEFLDWEEDVFGDLSDSEIETKKIRKDKLKNWIRKNLLHALLIESENYPLLEKLERDPKFLIRSELTKENVINQFFFDDHQKWDNIITQCICEVLSRIGFVQSIFNQRVKDVLNRYIFFKIRPTQNGQLYHLICSQMTDDRIVYLVNKENEMTSLEELFLEENLSDIVDKPLTKDELKAKLEKLSQVSEEKIWVFSENDKEFLPERKNKILYKLDENVTVINGNGRGKGKENITKSACAFYHIPGEIFVVPNKLMTDQAKFLGVLRLESNKDMFLTRSKFLMKTTEEFIHSADVLHYLMYLNAQFNSSTSVPYPLQSMKYINEFIEAIEKVEG